MKRPLGCFTLPVRDLKITVIHTTTGETLREPALDTTRR